MPARSGGFAGPGGRPASGGVSRPAAPRYGGGLTGGVQSRVVARPQPPPRYRGSPQAGGWRRQPAPLAQVGRPTVFPKGFTPASALPTQQRLQQAREAGWKARGYESVTLSSGLRVQMPIAMAQSFKLNLHLASGARGTTGQPSSFPFQRRFDQRPLTEYRGWWRKAGKLLGDVLNGNVHS
jgi:hypothetical protein